MKVIKRGLYIIIFIISLFIININAKAYNIYVDHNDITYTEENIYQEFSKIEGFNINKYPNIYCTKNIYDTATMNCYAFSKDIIFIENTNSSDLLISKEIENCNYYHLYFHKVHYNDNYGLLRECSFNSYNVIRWNNYTYSNFDFNVFDESTNLKYNKLDFSPYMLEEEEKVELEITIKGTEILNFILDKTKNIYEILINNQIFKLCLGVLLSYLIFMVIYRVLKK